MSELFSAGMWGLFLLTLTLLWVGSLWSWIKEERQRNRNKLREHQQPVGGRWCAKCGGLLAYRRWRETGEGGKVRFITALHCWRCRKTLPLLVEPDFAQQQAERQESGEG